MPPAPDILRTVISFPGLRISCPMHRISSPVHHISWPLPLVFCPRHQISCPVHRIFRPVVQTDRSLQLQRLPSFETAFQSSLHTSCTLVSSHWLVRLSVSPMMSYFECLPSPCLASSSWPSCRCGVPLTVWHCSSSAHRLRCCSGTSCPCLAHPLSPRDCTLQKKRMSIRCHGGPCELDSGRPKIPLCCTRADRPTPHRALSLSTAGPAP